MLEFDRRDRSPCFLEGAKEHLQDDFDDPRFGGREQPTGRELPHTATKSTKKAVQRAEHDGRVNHHHGITPQRGHSDDVDRQGRLEFLDVVAKTHNLRPRRVDPGAGAQHLQHAQAEHADEALVDHVQRGDVHPQAAVLCGQIVFANLDVQVVARVDFHASIVEAGRQCGQFLWRQQVLRIRHVQ